ncbi:cytochrome P450 2J6-like [Ostrea edulis]|uniref:cytochrome P450 2J6-like n=1 Tax=Ostrea edulis TaxID=37623 RepID=UPI0024AF660D|nr:cytochrome P450 2J6-like [Ostrea edulis]
MDTVAIILTTIFGFLVFLCVFWRKKRNLPPGPTPVPLLGNLILFRKDPRAYKLYTKLAEEYGNIYSLHCGSTLIVILNGYDAINEAFVKQADVFTDRPQLFVPLIGVSKGTGLTYNSDRPWKILRRFALQALRDFGVGKKSLEDRIQEEVHVVMETLKISDGQPIRVKPLFLSAATNIICSVMFGARFQYTDDRFNELTDVLDSIFRLNAPFAKENFFPFTRNLPGGKELIRKRSAAIEKVKQYLAVTIKEHEETFDPDIIRDFIDLYIKASRDESDPEIYTEANVYKVIVDLFLAGGETTGTSLDWSLLYMITFPDTQRKCQEEIDHVVGKSRSVGLEDRGKMPYLEATLLEIQRIANTLTFSLPHIAKQDTQLLGFDIPKDAIIIANLYSAHIDQKYWEEPHMFKPERFLNDAGSLKRRDAFVPFSTGPRFCIGEPLARMELFLFFTNLLQRFRFSMDDKDNPPSLDGIQALTLTALPYRLVAIPR